MNKKTLYSIGIGFIFTLSLFGITNYYLTNPIFSFISDWKDDVILAWFCFFLFASLEEIFKLAMYKQSNSFLSVYTFIVIEWIQYVYFAPEGTKITVLILRIIPAFLHIYWTKLSIKGNIEFSIILHTLFNYIITLTIPLISLNFNVLSVLMYYLVICTGVVLIIDKINKIIILDDILNKYKRT